MSHSRLFIPALAALCLSMIPVVGIGQQVVADPAASSAQKPWTDAFHPKQPPADAPAIPEAMEQLFVAMEKAASDSASVFRPLTVNQMDHKPADGTHTARWNAEHLAGAQVMFFSQIFHAMDSEIPVIADMPKQMPADYEPVHPGWDGAMVADWMTASTEYCRRYAYLLSDTDLEKKLASNRFGTLQKLLKTMQGHYGSHTGNVKKKMQASDWPN